MLNKWTVEKLRDALNELCDSGHCGDVVVVWNPEANFAGYLEDIEIGAYDKHHTFGYAELTQELELLGYEEEDIVSGVPAIALYS